MALTPDVINGGRSSSTWANEIRDRTVQTFENVTELNGWAAPEGASARTLDDGLWWARYQGAWTEVVLLGPQGETGAPGQATIIVGEFGPGGKLPADLPPDGLIPVDWDGPGRPSVAHQMIPGESLYYRSALGPTDPIDGHLFQFVGTATPAGWLDIGLVRGPVGPEGAEGPMGPQGSVGPDEVIISSGAPSATTADLWVDVGDSTTGGSYLPLAGGDMELDAVIAWPDTEGSVGGPRLILWPAAADPPAGVYGLGVENTELAVYIGESDLSYPSAFTIYAGDDANRVKVFTVFGNGVTRLRSPQLATSSAFEFPSRELLDADGMTFFYEEYGSTGGLGANGAPNTYWKMNTRSGDIASASTMLFQNGALTIPGAFNGSNVLLTDPAPTDGGEPTTTSLLAVIEELRARITALEAR